MFLIIIKEIWTGVNSLCPELFLGGNFYPIDYFLVIGSLVLIKVTPDEFH
jgi:hypothetical protein